MNKKEFVKGLADNMGVTVKEAAIAFDCFMDQLMATIATGDKFTIVGFGSFYSEDKAARTARNPKTGEPIEVPAKRVPKFKYSEKFKKTIFAGGATEAKAETEVEEVEEAVEVEDDVKFDVYDDEALSKLVDEQVVDESLIDDDPDIYIGPDGEEINLAEFDD